MSHITNVCPIHLDWVYPSDELHASSVLPILVSERRESLHFQHLSRGGNSEQNGQQKISLLLGWIRRCTNWDTQPAVHTPLVHHRTKQRRHKVLSQASLFFPWYPSIAVHVEIAQFITNRMKSPDKRAKNLVHSPFKFTALRCEARRVISVWVGRIKSIQDLMLRI